MKIKICGLFRCEDIEFVNDATPDYIGFVFAESRRRVDMNKAKELRSRLKDGITPVGVFVNADISYIAEVKNEEIIGIAQLHGEEDSGFIAKLKSKVDITVIKAIRMESKESLKKAPQEADYFLLDSGAGGTGSAFDWSFIDNIKKPFFLAGGIDIANIDNVVHFNPYAVDISSGAETNGLKDMKKIDALVKRAHGL